MGADLFAMLSICSCTKLSVENGLYLHKQNKQLKVTPLYSIKQVYSQGRLVLNGTPWSKLQNLLNNKGFMLSITEGVGYKRQHVVGYKRQHLSKNY